MKYVFFFVRFPGIKSVTLNSNREYGFFILFYGIFGILFDGKGTESRRVMINDPRPNLANVDKTPSQLVIAAVRQLRT